MLASIMLKLGTFGFIRLAVPLFPAAAHEVEIATTVSFTEGPTVDREGNVYFSEIMTHEPDGFFLSNGPGDPAATGEYAVPVIRKMLETRKPLFGSVSATTRRT